jgi:Fic family protein
MAKDYPPFALNSKILNISLQIRELIGRWDGINRPKPKINLRKENRIKTIQSSLAIEGNTLSFDQVSAILENKRVLGPPKDILEVQNALATYQMAENLNPFSEKDFFRAHKELMVK